MKVESVRPGRRYAYERNNGPEFKERGVAKVLEIVHKANGPWLVCEITVTWTNARASRRYNAVGAVRGLEMRPSWLLGPAHAAGKKS